MTSIIITFHEDSVRVPIIHQPESVEFLLHQFEETQRHEQMFKEAMMKAQSQSDLMRRFIEKHELQEQFALFVMENRKHARRPDVLNEFGFIRQQPTTKED